ncbi:DUF4920 domain-containing protein [Weeksellaceae bacterium KMM 9713]|uniref:DUF4920 domain-containing protein n=1 Tax=Profundicola chukchiensis TaxID=2961959 RepID=A0A9X4MXP1_9FLAO|nr:DUF4920 domain-containing protein [Profundicola chukchiensis]MDG4945445.1 DUF4920 domain-containing protein [Profundicola chukchiensis]
MKLLAYLMVFTFVFSCSEQKNEDVKMIEDYASFGKEITADGAISQEEMLAKFNELQVGDTATIKFASKVNSVCQAKGCWMKLALDPETETMVKFKDYDFFVPKDIAESDAIVEGKAYKEEMTVEDQQHYAKDAGKSEEEIAAITEPKMVYNFEAEGVLIK